MAGSALWSPVSGLQSPVSGLSFKPPTSGFPAPRLRLTVPPAVATPTPERDFSDLQKPLEHFRAKTKRLRVHPAESALLAVVGAHLVFLPWALGAMWAWAQWTSLAFAVVGFGLSLLPRQYTEEHTGANAFRLIMWPKLVRFPIFWLGLLLLAYVAAQGLNPAWRYTTSEKGWWMTAIPHVAGLPRGVDVPFVRGGPWRMLVVYASAWLTVCTLWVGFTRRRTVQTFLLVLAGNGLLLAGFGIAQRLLGNGKIFWFFDSPNAAFFSSFVYKNHAGAYLLLMLALTCGLAGWYYLRGLRRLEKSNPSGVLAFFGTLIAVSILTSYARGVTLTMLGFLCVVVAAFVAHQLFVPNEHRKPVVAIVLILIFGYFLKNGFEALRAGEAWDRIRQGVTRQDGSLEYREYATEASLQMLRENGLTGVGAGSYRFLFTIYQHRHPKLAGPGVPKMYWEHAHNDVVQFPIELGIGGMVLLLASAGYWAVGLLRAFFWENPLSVCTVFGAVLLVVYAWWDFPFQCPAILITWCALWPAVTMWTRFEEQNAKG